jgi:hypothetical protein
LFRLELPSYDSKDMPSVKASENAIMLDRNSQGALSNAKILALMSGKRARWHSVTK